MSGKVYLVGCGPGAADLLTLRAVETLRKADVVLYDRLADPKALGHAVKARKIPSGKKPGESLKQGWINRRLYSEARKGNVVVRLKNGDPMVFGRGGEELQYLQHRGVDVEVVPGLSSAISVPSLSKIPLTKRGVSSSLTILTGHRAEGRRQGWRNLGGTVVVLMAVENLGEVVEKLKRMGKPAATPCALISSGATDEERLAVSTLGRIFDFSRRAGLRAPAVLVVGEVVSGLLDFKGKRITTFRAKDEVKRTERLVRRAGGVPKVFEICETSSNEQWLRAAASKEWDTLVFMSAAGVRSVAEIFDFRKHKLVAVGGTTRAELMRRGFRRVWVPREQSLAGVRELLKKKNLGRVLAFRSPLATEKLAGATNVVAYKVKPKNLEQTVRTYLKIKSDYTLLTSSGLLKYLLNSAQKIGLKKRFLQKINSSFVISLGKEITEISSKNGININHEPEKPTIDTLFAPSGSPRPTG
ncbi:MAG: uroporphyrinogen-III C-methyltransferase [Candidatus Hadarchaeota archaeon]